MKIKQIKEWLRHPYAWPGGYEMVAITTDGAALCHDCARQNFSSICYSQKHKLRDGWQIEAIDCLWEGGNYCDQCCRNVDVYPADENEVES